MKEITIDQVWKTIQVQELTTSCELNGKPLSLRAHLFVDTPENRKSFERDSMQKVLEYIIKNKNA